MPAANQSPDVLPIPRWVMVTIGTVFSLVFAGLLTWLTSMNAAIQKNAVDIAAIKVEVLGQAKSMDHVKSSLDRMNDKLDRLLERLSK